MSLSEKSKNIYESSIKRLVGIANTVNLYDTKRMIEVIDGLTLSLATKKAYYVALQHYTTDNITVNNIYKEKFIAINKVLKEQSMAQTLTPAEAEKWMTWPELQEVGLSIMKDETVDLEKRILAGMCTQIPPARLDYTNLKIYTGDTPADVSGNFIEVRVNGSVSMEVFIQEHKTAKSYGTLRRLLPRPLITLIQTWIGRNGKNAILFDITPATLSKRIIAMFHKATGKSISMNILRHAYVNEQRKGDMPLATKNTLAMTMGHSLTMNDVYRRI